VGADKRFRVLPRGPEPKNAALNRGVQAAQYDILVFLDADGIVFSDWLKELTKPIMSGASVSFGERFPDKETWISLAEVMQNIQTYQISRSTSIQGDRSIAIRRDVLERVGPLPTIAYAREDWDLGIRLWKADEPVIFSKSARLITSRPSTIKEFWRNDVRWRRTHLNGLWEHKAFFVRHPWMAIGQLYVYGFSITLALATAAGSILAIFKPNLRLILAKVAVLTLFWIGGRRAALGAEVSAYTGEYKWVIRSWSSAVQIFVSFLASIVAILTVRQGTPVDYKGPRRKRASNS